MFFRTAEPDEILFSLIPGIATDDCDVFWTVALWYEDVLISLTGLIVVVSGSASLICAVLLAIAFYG